MQTNIKTLIKQIFNEQGLDKIKQTEETIVKLFGKNFLKKEIQNIYINNKTIIIKTSSIEAKTEINLRKTQINKKFKVEIK